MDAVASSTKDRISFQCFEDFLFLAAEIETRERVRGLNQTMDVVDRHLLPAFSKMHAYQHVLVCQFSAFIR